MSISLNGAIKFLRKKLVVMDLFNLPINEFKKEINKIVEENTKTELLHDLVECGLELSKEDKAKWIDPLIIDTEEEAAALLDAMEKAATALLDAMEKEATAQRKEIQISISLLTSVRDFSIAIITFLSFLQTKKSYIYAIAINPDKNTRWASPYSF